MKNRIISVLVLLLTMVSAASARQRSDLEIELNRQLAGKMKVMRHPCAGTHLVYDIHSGPIGACTDYEWSTDVIIKLKDISVTEDGFHIEAERVLIAFDSKRGEFGAAQKGSPVRIEARLGRRPTEVSEADAFFASFTRVINDVADLAPPYWQACLRGELRKGDQKRWWCYYQNSGDIRSDKKDRPNPTQISVFQLNVDQDGKRTYTVRHETTYFVDPKKGITPPRATYDPEPSYPSRARELNRQGTTILRLLIDESGKPKDVQISSPEGMGFDEQAVRTVYNWRFQPATFQGKPVPVLVNVEVNYRLH